MKTLNIELNVRHMEAQNILTASAQLGPDTSIQLAPERQGGVAAPSAAGAAPVRVGF